MESKHQYIEYKHYIIRQLHEVRSTNDFLKQLKDQGKVRHGTVILADFQTMGRGTGENIWHSEPAKNLLFSAFVEQKINVSDHFILNIAVSLAIVELLSDLGIAAKIKWPNDIYCDDRKLAGLLIENSIFGHEIVNSIIGVGMNVNQTYFPSELPNPVSIFQRINRKVDINELLKNLLDKLAQNFDNLKEETNNLLISKYTENLYRLNELAGFEDANGYFDGYIRGINSNGELLVEDTKAANKSYQFGEIKFLI